MRRGEHARDAHATEGVVVRQGAYLPHWTREGGIYHVVFRLFDSIPKQVYEDWIFERDAIRKRAQAQNRPLTAYEESCLVTLHSEKVERFLDQGTGSCFFNNPAAATLMSDALRHFDGERYDLHAWCVMPNHVHTIVEPQDGHTLSQILHSWKSYTAHEINKLLGRDGDFWQTEYFDHLIRNERDYANAVEYVLRNPAVANLKDWPYVARASRP